MTRGPTIAKLKFDVKAEREWRPVDKRQTPVDPGGATPNRDGRRLDIRRSVPRNTKRRDDDLSFDTWMS